MSGISAYERHQLLRKAHEEGLITYDEDRSSDEVYVVATVDGRVLRVAAPQVVAFCDGLAAGFAAGRDAGELDRSLRVALEGAASAFSAHCKYCGAPLTSWEAVRCTVCGRSQAKGA